MSAFEKHRAALRRDGVKVTAYRLGYQVGLAAEALGPPYENINSRRQYMRGLVDGGVALRIERQRRLNEES